MMRAMVLAAACLMGATTAASAQGGIYSKAKSVSQGAAAATSAHIQAEQQPVAPSTAVKSAPAAAPAKSRTSKSSAAPSASVAQAEHPVTKLNIAPADTVPPAIIMREAYDYSRDGRRDPFYSLLLTSELRPSMSDLRLTGILYDHSGEHSVATLRDVGTNELYRVTTGTPLGRMRVSEISVKKVVFTIDEFGTTRQDSLVLGDSTKVRGK